MLDQVMRWQSLGFVVAMLVGGAVYDPAFLNRLFGSHLEQGTTLRLPIYLNLLTAVATLITALGLREPKLREKQIVGRVADRRACRPDPALERLAGRDHSV